MGYIRTGINDYQLEVAKGNVSGHVFGFKIGYNEVIGTTEKVLWNGTGIFGFLTSAETIDFQSDSAEDAAAGNGARSIYVQGLDSNWNMQSEIVIPLGLNIATTTKEYLRFDDAFVLTALSTDPITGGNLGTIEITSHDTTINMGQIDPYALGVLNCVLSVPSGKTAMIRIVGMGTGQGKETIFRAKMRISEAGPFRLVWEKVIYQDTFWPIFPGFVPVPEKHDVLVTTQAKIGTVDADASMSYFMVDN